VGALGDVWNDALGQVDNWNATFKQIQGEFGKETANLNARMTVLASLIYADTVDEWLSDIPECQVSRATFRELQAATTNLDSHVQNHDSNVLSYVSKAAHRKKLMDQRADLEFSGQNEFRPFAILNMILMTLQYEDIKGKIIRTLKLMRSSTAFQFCEEGDFLMDNPSRLIQLEAYLFELVTQREMKRSFGSGRSVGATNPQSLVYGQGLQSSALSVLKFQRSNTDDFSSFREFDRTGLFTIDVYSKHLLKKIGVANERIVSVQAFSPELLKANGGTGKYAQMWVRRQGLSFCTHPKGASKRFTHKERTWTSIYSTDLDQNAPPTWVTDNNLPRTEIGVSPYGTWDVGIPTLAGDSNKDARGNIKEIEIHVITSFEVCESAECMDSPEAHTVDLAHRTSTSSVSTMPVVPAMSLISLGAVLAFLSLFMVASFSFLRRGNPRHVPDQEPRQAEGQVEHAVLNRSNSARRAPMLHHGECQ